MRPRGLPASWRRVTRNYAYEKRQPTRAAELAVAVQADGRPASMLQPFTFALGDDESELTRVPMRPTTAAEEAEDVW